MSPRHFLDLHEHSAEEIKHIVSVGHGVKKNRSLHANALAGKTLAMIFEKPSLRTRVSFDVGMNQLGGHAIMLTGSEIQLKSDTSIPDAARALSRYVNLIMFRTHDHGYLTGLAEHATIPVINGLTNDTHPCQVLADIMAYEEHRGSLTGKTVAWTGDGRDNVCTSWIHAAMHYQFKFKIAAPKGHQPTTEIIAMAHEKGAFIEVTDDPASAVKDADCVLTDTWVSMGQEAESITRREIFTPYQVNAALMAQAKKDAVFMHCLPAYRGLEVTSDVIDGPQSIVWDAAENRLHAQKAVMLWCMGVI
ncbi:MAG TPA: ornithine carbamoyltransferase [Alphaproteobacteria bacterium]|nr:ornithine carbamoyltransferase [Rhodospirillaceae bacterium]HRJ12003.1 ornithine carbamoyltransferase [Alphaproteobacteria bacterium]